MKASTPPASLAAPPEADVPWRCNPADQKEEEAWPGRHTRAPATKDEGVYRGFTAFCSTCFLENRKQTKECVSILLLICWAWQLNHIVSVPKLWVMTG